MRRRTKVIIIFSIAFILAVISRLILDLIPYKYDKGETIADHLSPERIKVMSPDKIVKLINPQPSTIVLDIGAGYGLFTFPLARMVGKSGKVFATDVEPQVITYLTHQALKQGLTNVIPVKVTSFGLDPFYTKHSFDTILASDVLPDIVMLQRFLKKLRPSLKRNTGRLWITITRADPDFTDMELIESAGILKVLRSVRVQTTIGPRFRTITNQALEAQSKNNLGHIVALVTEDINKMLEDRTLWPESQDKKWPISQRDTYLIQGLSGVLGKQGVFKIRTGALDEKTKLVLRLLNRLVIMDLLEMELWGKAIIFRDLTKKDARHLVQKFETPVGSQAIVSLFRTAGYELVKEHKTNPYCYIFEFMNPAN
jgi:2-polyprenyl-3-methyl-5-hydroxy-6-metoxy-1,4-benzoquinol methylase